MVDQKSSSRIQEDTPQNFDLIHPEFIKILPVSDPFEQEQEFQLKMDEFTATHGATPTARTLRVVLDAVGSETPETVRREERILVKM